MSMTLAEATLIIARRIRAEEATPGSSDLDIHANTVAAWLNELTSQVVEMLRFNPENYKEFQELISMDDDLTLDVNGVAALSGLTTFDVALAIKCGASKVDADLTHDPKQFSFFDSSNWLLVSTAEHPIALIADGNIYVKPVVTYASGIIYIDHSIPHPTIGGAQGTVFSQKGDDILIELFMGQYYAQLAEGDSDGVFARLAELHYNKAMELAHGPNVRSTKK